jgi:PAS domain S-box-containing protein
MSRQEGNRRGEWRRLTLFCFSCACLLVIAQTLAGPVDVGAEQPDDRPGAAASSSTVDDSLARLRALSPEEDPTGYIQLARELLATHPGRNQPALESEVRAGIGLALLVDERFKEAVIELRAAADLAHQAGREDLQSRSLANLARARFQLGDFEECDAACREALDLPSVAGNPDRSWLFQNIQAAVQLHQGDFEAAIKTSSHALEDRVRAGDKHAQAILLNNIGVAHMYLGDHEPALEYLQRARVLKTELGETAGVTDILSNIGDIKHLQGKSEEAIEIHREALRLRLAEGGEARVALSHRSLAAALHAAGRDREALSQVKNALEIVRRLDLEPEVAACLPIEAEILAALGQSSQAIASASEGLDLARMLGMKGREVVALDAMIAAQTAAGDTKTAMHYQTLAREIERELAKSEVLSEFAEFQAEYDAREKTTEIQLLRKNNELQALALSHQRLWRNSLIIGIILLAIIAAAGWHRVLARRREIEARQRADAALLKSMKRYRLLFERNLTGVFQTNLNGTIGTTNRAFATMLGFKDSDELSGRAIIDFTTAPEEFQLFLQELSFKRELHNREFTMVTRNGELVTILINAGRIDDGDDDGDLIEGIAMDVSDRNRAEEDRRRLAFQLQQSQKLESLGVLAGGIAHDFNNMLMAILSNISLAKRSAAAPDETLRRLNEAEEVCLRATGLTQQLLTFSKGGRPIRNTASIGRLIEETTATAARGGNCHYDCRSNPELWPVEVDVGQIAQVIQNLVANAIEAMPNGGTVSVTADNAHLVEGDVSTLEAGRYIRIEVVDTGCGIPEEELESVFDPFFTTKKGSSGLGLATAFSIVRSHGGAIVVHSEPGRGSRFSVFLPASEEEQIKRAVGAEDSMHGHGRLLIMDDDEAVRSAAAELLETIGYKVATAADGSEAITLYTRAMEEGNPYDAVVLDLTVPEGVGGRETMTRLLAIDPGVKAIVSSGYSTDPVMANYREHGFSGVAVKPYRLADLARTLKLAINKHPNG